MSSPTYLLYARRSSEDDDHQALSIEQQLDALRELAVKRGITIEEEFVESASAKDPGRPVFGKLMKRIRAGQVHGLLVWRPDRLARNMVDGGELIYHLSSGHLKEIITPESTYTSASDSKFMLVLLFGAATKYSDDLSSAVRRGNQDVLRRGKIPGPVPLGYMKTHEHELSPGVGTVIPDPERFETVKKIWRGALSSKNLNVSDLWRKARDECGLTTRPTKGVLAHPVGLTNLYGLLRNPFYAGKIRRGSEFYKGEHPPMVTWEEFQTVQNLLNGKPIETAPKPKHEFLYHHLLHCGSCGREVIGERHEKHGRTYIYYRCDRRKQGQYICPEQEVREQDITISLEAALDRVTIDPTIRDWAFEAMAWWAGEDEVSPEKLARKAKEQLARAEAGLVTLTDLVIKDFITEEEYKVRRINQRAKIDHLREALTEPMEKLEAWRRLRDEKKQNGLKLSQEFREGDDLLKRKILTRTCEDILIKDKTVVPKLKTPFQYRAESPNFQSGLSRTDEGEV